MISKLIILCIVATTTLADMSMTGGEDKGEEQGEEEVHQGMTGAEEDYHPFKPCQDGSTPMCPTTALPLVPGEKCD